MIRRSHRGVALVTAIMILVVLGILIPALILLEQKESKDAISSNRKTIAFQLAEAGQDRASWKLRESDTMWQNFATGVAVAGYNDDLEYTDVAGGKYKIKISSGPGLAQVTVISKGRATNLTDLRAIKAVYGKGTTIGAMSVAGTLQYKPNLTVHWGPVVTYSNITMSRTEHYPRMYAVGYITGRDTVNDSNNGALPSGNWTGYDYTAFYDLGTAPSVNLDYYKSKAKSSAVPKMVQGSGSANTYASPWNSGGFNSGYYPANALGGSTGNPNGVRMQLPSNGDYFFSCTTCTIYIEGDIATWKSGSYVNSEALIATGSVDYNGGANNYSATIPSNAQDQYLCTTSPSAAAFWSSMGWTNGGTYVVPNVGYHGFLYCGGNMGNSGGGAANVVGAIYVGGNVTVNNLGVYYDASVASGVNYANATVTRASWDEIRTTW